MAARSPRRFPIDDRRIYDAYIAGRQSAALAAAVRCGLFDALASAPASEAEIASRFGWGARPTSSFLTALAAMGLITREGDAYGLAEDTAQYAVRGPAGSLWALIDLEVEHGLTAERLLTALASDDSTVYGDQDPWERHAADPEQARAFTAAMHSVSERPAAGLAEVVDFGGVGRVLDVGGGSGAVSIEIARRWPDVRCVVLDLPIVCEAARGFVAEAGLSDRVSAEAGDMFAAALPTGFDVVLFSQILHDWPMTVGQELVERAFDSLPSGGRVLIHEKLIADDADAPLANALVHLDMLVWTRGQQYRFSELRKLLEVAGFESATCRPTAGYWSVVEAGKP